MKGKTKIPNHNNIPVIDIFLKELHDYLPNAIYEPTISIEEQNQVIEKLKSDTVRAKFSFIIDGLTGDIKHHFGIKKWLGYPEDEFTTETFLEIVHRSHTIPYWMNGSCIWDVVSGVDKLVTFNDVSVVYTMGLKHLDGKYFFCSCESSFFQVSKDAKGIEFLYEFTVLRIFSGEDFNISFFDKNGQRQDALDLLIKAKKEKFRSIGMFSPQEMNILDNYAKHPDNNSEDIAAAFKIKKETVSTHNTNILDKAELFFYYRFESAKKFAYYLKRLELI